MQSKYQLDNVKFNHWLNIRKMTYDVLNEHLSGKVNYKINKNNSDQLDRFSIDKIAEVLEIPTSYLLKDEETPVFLFKTKEEIEKTKRPIRRDGIHFYNYYTLPTPHSYIAPVLIDILCPKEKLPKLNHGHLEPATTISLGPNDIYARFAKKINKTNWVKFKINPDQKTNWVVGSSYYEPSYCLHTYSRATDGPGKILSYTTKSNLENLLGKKLNDNSFKNMINSIGNLKVNRYLFKQDIFGKGYSLEEIAKKTKIPLQKIKNYFKNNKIFLNNSEINKICNIIQSDPNLYADRIFKEDKVGKLYYDYKDSLKTKRKFKSYLVASTANSARYPDLFGYFIKVTNSKKKQIIDLMDGTCSHYLVTGGEMKFNILDGNKKLSISIKEGDAFWISAFTKHGFSGNGSLVKLSDGQNINYLEKQELIKTFNLKNTLKRGRQDKQNWGYDETSVN